MYRFVGVFPPCSLHKSAVFTPIRNEFRFWTFYANSDHIAKTVYLLAFQSVFPNINFVFAANFVLEKIVAQNVHDGKFGDFEGKWGRTIS